MPTLYKRFTEKEARQWRQIYKVGWLVGMEDGIRVSLGLSYRYIGTGVTRISRQEWLRACYR